MKVVGLWSGIIVAKRASLMSGTARSVAYADGYSMTPAQAAQTEAARGSPAANNDPMMKRSADSASMLEYWDTVDAIVDGVKALKDSAHMFMPKFPNEDSQDYAYRKSCAKLTNIYRDTLEGLAAKPFEKEVEIVEDDGKSVPEKLIQFAENVDGSGNNLTAFAGATFFNGINSAIDWIYVDHPPLNPAIKSVADAKASGVRPYWSHILGRNVLDVQSDTSSGKETINYIKIHEPGSPDRVRIFERSANGAITWQLHKRNPDKQVSPGQTQFELEDSGTLTIDVIPFVPFITGRRDGRSWRFFPAMRDAADLQITLFQNESALEYAKRLAAYPMLAGNGVKPPVDADGQPQKLAVGPGRVLYAPPMAGGGSGGSWAYVEPSATSLKFLADDNKETQQQLRELARQPLTAQSSGITVINSAAAAGKAKSAVKAWGLALVDALENALVITDKYAAITPDEYDPTVSVYLEFDEFLDGKDLDALGTAVTAGKISDATYRYELKRRNVLSSDFNEDDEEARLLEQLPGGDGAPDTTQGVE